MPTIQIKRGVSAAIAAYTPLAGELVFDTTNKALRVGDGVTPGGSALSLVASAVKLATPRTISTTGDVTWSVTFDGSGNVTGAATLADTGVTAGTFTRVTVDGKGRVTAGQSSALAVANGGTGSSTPAAARTALGVAFTAWANLTLQNSWVVVSSRLARYRSFLDMVCLEVNIQGGTITDGTVLFTLPAGSRPPNAQTIPVASSPASTSAAAKVLINPDGTVACYNCTNAPGISFSTTFATV